MRHQVKKRLIVHLGSIGFLIALGISLFPICAYAQSSSNSWSGSYEFFDADKGGPKNQPGNFITYTLIVSQSGDRLTARFTADGTQTSDDYECRVELLADSIKVFFVKDVGGMEEGKAAPLKNDDLIFTLTKTVTGKKPRYLFRKGKYEIYPLSVIPKNKIYFEEKKVKSS